MGARFGEGQTDKDEGSGDHHGADGLTKISCKGMEAAEVRCLLTQYQSDP